MALKHCNNELKVVFDDKIQQWPLRENAPVAIAEASQSYRNVASLWQL